MVEDKSQKWREGLWRSTSVQFREATRGEGLIWFECTRKTCRQSVDQYWLEPGDLKAAKGSCAQMEDTMWSVELTIEIRHDNVSGSDVDCRIF